MNKSKCPVCGSRYTVKNGEMTALNNRILTFTGWEDNSTDMERTVRMNGEKNITANFSCVE